MKLLFLLLITFSLSSQANEKREIYFTSSMNCIGDIGGNVKSVHSDYHQVQIKVNSFWSLRKNGCKKAPSVKASFGYPAGLGVFNFSDYSSDWYGKPIYKIKDQIIVDALDYGFGAGPLKLQIISTNDKRDVLSGRWYHGNTPAASDPDGYWYNLTCVSSKADSADLEVLNLTSTCSNYPKNDALEN